MTYDLNDEISKVEIKYNAWSAINASQKDGLYELLASNLGIIENISTDHDLENIKARLESNKIKVNDKSSIELKIIRLIMTRESQKASVYAIVLKAAREAGIKSEGFAEWLKAEGGIEAVRKANSKSKNPTNIQQRYEAGKKIALSKTPLVTFRLNIPHAQKNDLVSLVARVGDNNQVSIVGIAGTGESNDLVVRSVSAISPPANSNLQGVAVASNPGQVAVASLVRNTTASLACGSQANA
jgi:uncharacterized protein YegP (UPF0339 family)